MTATPSQEWTEESERWLEFYSGLDSEAHGVTGKLAREILRQRDEVARLRAENERLTQERIEHLGRLVGYAREIGSLRSQLAATRERETPDAKDAGQFATDVRWEIYTVDRGIFSRTCETREEADALIRHQRNPENFEILRATTSRSRESDNA